MGRCAHHPDRESPYTCLKHGVSLCEECLDCRDPRIYCKYRTACPIWFLTRRKKGLDSEGRPDAQPPAP